MFETVVSVVVMFLSAVVGMFAGIYMMDSMAGGAILFALIAGIACIVHVLTNKPQQQTSSDDEDTE